MHSELHFRVRASGIFFVFFCCALVKSNNTLFLFVVVVNRSGPITFCIVNTHCVMVSYSVSKCQEKSIKPPPESTTTRSPCSPRHIKSPSTYYLNGRMHLILHVIILFINQHIRYSSILHKNNCNKQEDS